MAQELETGLLIYHVLAADQQMVSDFTSAKFAMHNYQV